MKSRRTYEKSQVKHLASSKHQTCKPNFFQIFQTFSSFVSLSNLGRVCLQRESYWKWAPRPIFIGQENVKILTHVIIST